MSSNSFMQQMLDIRPSDSHLTAYFQKLCGIKIKYEKKNKHTENHLNGDVNGTSKSSSSSNGHSSKSEVHNGSTGQNGFINHASKLNGVKLNGLSNGVHHHQNGLTQRYKNHENSNGSVSLHTDIKENHKSCSNGHAVRPTEKVNFENGGHFDEDNSEWKVTYSVEKPFLYYLFSFGASLGNEIFYVFFFSFALWNFDNVVMRKALIPWVTVMYLGQAAKDVIRWPRPSSPPVVRLEERYELEYGMPSTHAMVGVAIPFGMLYYMTGRYEFHILSGVLFAIAWSILVSFSRLYLGMHSVLDLMAGIVLSIILMVATIPFVDALDDFLLISPWAIPVTVTVVIILCLLYPSLDKWSTARGDTTLTLGVFSGIYMGLWVSRQLVSSNLEYYVPNQEPELLPFTLGLPATEVLAIVAIRQTLGVILLISMLTIMKYVVLHLFAGMWGLNPNDPATKCAFCVELPYKYLSYGLSSMAATSLLPIVFWKLGLARQSFYSELLTH